MTTNQITNPITNSPATQGDYLAAKARLTAAGFRAFDGANGWYIARVGADGSHGQDDHGFATSDLAWLEKLQFAVWAWGSENE